MVKISDGFEALIAIKAIDSHEKIFRRHLKCVASDVEVSLSPTTYRDALVERFNLLRV